MAASDVVSGPTINVVIQFKNMASFVPPRRTSTQRDAIASPNNGSVLYNTTTGVLECRESGAWVNL